jgi:hypothetical protein
MPANTLHRAAAWWLALSALASAAPAAAVSIASYSSAKGFLGSVAQAPDDKNFSSTTLAQVMAGVLLTSSSSSSAGTASGWASAAPGMLKAYNTLQVTATDSALVAERNYAGVVDVLHVSSATLAPGTPVTLTLNMAFTIGYSFDGPTLYMPVGINSTASLNDGTNYGVVQSDGPAQANGWGQGVDVTSLLFPTTVGADVTLDQRLSIDGSVGYVAGFGQKLTIDASHTALYFVDAPAGVVLTSATGHEYALAAAVPEPASVALLLAGACLLVGVRRRAAALP